MKWDEQDFSWGELKRSQINHMNKGPETEMYKMWSGQYTKPMA